MVTALARPQVVNSFTVQNVVAAASVATGVRSVVGADIFDFSCRDQPSIVGKAARILTMQPELLDRALENNFGSPDEALAALRWSYFLNMDASSRVHVTWGQNALDVEQRRAGGAVLGSRHDWFRAMGDEMAGTLSRFTEETVASLGREGRAAYRAAEFSPPNYFPLVADSQPAAITNWWEVVGFAGAEIVYGTRSFSPNRTHLMQVLRAVRRFQQIINGVNPPVTAWDRLHGRFAEVININSLGLIDAALCAFQEGGDKAVRDYLSSLSSRDTLAAYFLAQFQARHPDPSVQAEAAKTMAKFSAHKFAALLLKRDIVERRGREVLQDVMRRLRAREDADSVLTSHDPHVIYSSLAHADEDDRSLLLKMLAESSCRPPRGSELEVVREFLNIRKLCDDHLHLQRARARLAAAYAAVGEETEASAVAQWALEFNEGIHPNDLYRLLYPVLAVTRDPSLFAEFYRRFHNTAPGEERAPRFYPSPNVVAKDMQELYLLLAETEGTAWVRQGELREAGELFEQLAAFAEAAGLSYDVDLFQSRALRYYTQAGMWEKGREVLQKLRAREAAKVAVLSPADSLGVVERRLSDDLLQPHSALLALPRAVEEQGELTPQQLADLVRLLVRVGQKDLAQNYLEQLIKLVERDSVESAQGSTAVKERIRKLLERRAYADLGPLLDRLMELERGATAAEVGSEGVS